MGAERAGGGGTVTGSAPAAGGAGWVDFAGTVDKGMDVAMAATCTGSALCRELTSLGVGPSKATVAAYMVAA